MYGLLAPFSAETHGRFALPSVRSFPSVKASSSAAASLPLPASPTVLLPLLTSRSASRRRPFRRKARSPPVRVSTFLAQPPDLRRHALVVRASRSQARLPCLAAPHIRRASCSWRTRYLFVGSRVRSPLLSAPPSRVAGSRRFFALRFAQDRYDQLSQRTYTS